MEKKTTKIKVKVLKKFIDKHTGKVHEPTKDGTFLNITKERLEEIKAVDPNLVEEVVEEKTPKKSTKKDTE